MNTFNLGLVVLIYLLSLAYLGWLGYKKTSNAADYLVGGREMHPVVMALSYGATFISASAIVGFGGVAAAFGMGIQWLCMLNMLVGVIIAFIVFGLRTRKMGAKMGVSTFSQFLGVHFKSRGIRVFIAVVIFLSMPIYAAVVMKGGAVFIEQMFHVDYNISLLIFTLVIAAYVIAGGIKGVMYTDAMQACIMFACMGFLIFFLYHNVLEMSFTEANKELSAMATQVPEKFKSLGHVGWTAMPMAGSPQWYTLVTSLIMGVGIGCLAQPQLVVRFMTVKSGKELKRGVFIGCLFIFVTVGTIYHAGALSNLYFMKTEGMVATDLVKDIDKIIPYFISSTMPAWFSALFMLCILSASMSTLSAQFHTMGSALGSDIVGAYRDNGHKHARVIRFGVLVSIVVSYIICYMLPNDIIARGTSFFMGLCAVVFLPAYFCALYWRKATRQGVMASLWTGTLATLFCYVFVHEKESTAFGICRTLFGRDVLVDCYPIQVIDPILYALPLSVIALVGVSLMTKKKEVSSLSGKR
ncbi:MAG: sodium:solute symporter family protein [Bacteroidaceae bacterium]